MEPIWITTLVNAVTLFVILVIPLGLIGAGILLGLRYLRGGSHAGNLRLLLAGVVIVIGLLWLVLAFTAGVPPGQSPFLVIFPVLLILLLQIGFWVLVIAAAVWLVLWLARRMGVVGPARDTPLDILKTRYARGEITKMQFEEMRHELESN